MTTRTLLHTDLRASVLAGAAAGVVFFRPQALLSTVIAALYGLYGTLAALCGVIYVVVARKDPSEYYMSALARITNYAIGYKTRTPVRIKVKSNAKDERKHLAVVPNVATTAAVVSPLPPAQESAQTEDTPQYWKAVQEMMAKPGGRPDIVSQSTTTIRFPSATGRHAKPETDAMLSVYEDLHDKAAS